MFLTAERKIYAPARQKIIKGIYYFFTKCFHRPFQDKDLESREGRVKDQLENIKEQLSTNVTTPLQVPEINHDQPDTDNTLKLLTEKSTHLQDIYSETLRMVPEACKCSENLRNDFFDLACNGLRTGHYDIVHRVDGLESVQKEMSEEEKGAFKCLRELQINREREIEKLDLLWNCLLKAVRNSFTVKLRKPCTHENFRNVDFVYWPITIKFRIRKKTSKPQANYRCCLRLVISRLKPRKNVRNIVGQQLPTSLDVTHCVRLHTLLHVVRCCCVLLRKV